MLLEMLLLKEAFTSPVWAKKLRVSALNCPRGRLPEKPSIFQANGQKLVLDWLE